ncbi:zinc finger, CCHC-type containing protein, partial [Tanacetum coccineum]
DKNPHRTLGDYSRPSHEGYRNTIEVPNGNDLVPLRSDTIRLVQNGCSFHGLRAHSTDLRSRIRIKHLKDFFKNYGFSINLNVETMKKDALRLFSISLPIETKLASGLSRPPWESSCCTWEDLTTRFLAQFFPPGRTSKLRNDILMFQQHQGESLSEAWTRFKDLLQKVPHHGIDLWLQIQIFYDHVNPITRRTIDQAAGGKLRDKNDEESWALLEDLALYDNESWNDPRDFAKPVKAISMPHDVPSTSDHRLIELENQVQLKKEKESRDTTPREHEGLTSEVDDEVGSNELEEEEEDDLEYFNTFPSMKELEYHEWLLKKFLDLLD